MNAITGLHEAVAVLGPIVWHQFGIIRRFCIVRTPDIKDDCNVEVMLVSDGRSPAGWMSVRFESVRNLTLQSNLEGDFRILGLDVVPIADRQWNEIAWEVLDFENNSLRFYCRTVVVTDAGLS